MIAFEPTAIVTLDEDPANAIGLVRALLGLPVQRAAQTGVVVAAEGEAR